MARPIARSSSPTRIEAFIGLPWRCPEWKVNVETEAALTPAPGHDSAPVGLDGPAHDGEPGDGALRLPRKKRLEESRQLFGRHARTVVRDLEASDPVVAPERHPHVPHPLARKLQRVARVLDEIDHDLT